MLATYQKLVALAHREFSDVVSHTSFVGGTVASPNKLRIALKDGSFVEVWLSIDGDYAYHWEQRRQRGRLFRWDNAPHHPHVGTFPDHLHEGDEATIRESRLVVDPNDALRFVLSFIRTELS